MKLKLTITYIIFYLFFDILLSNFYFNVEKKNYGKLHKFYHHTFKENLDTEINFGPLSYKFCSNIYGFRIHCENRGRIKKNFRYALIGDSYVEGQGDYEETFAGIFERKFPDTVNLGVSSYSTIIYFSKIFELIENQSFNFGEIILFFDPSDVLQDQAFRLNEDNSIKEVNLEDDKDHITRHKQWKRSNIKDFLYNNFKITHFIFVNVRDNLFPKRMIVFNNRSIDWAIHDESVFFQNKSIDEILDYSFEFLIKLSDYLKDKNIDLSIVIYPHPTELLHSQKNSKIVQKFENFCNLRCHKFINLHNFFFDEVDKFGLIKTYKKYFIFRDNHLNKEGNIKFAEKLIEKYR